MLTLIACGILAFALLNRRGAGAGSGITTAATGDPVQSIAEAIAHAEGYYAGDTLPYRNNNPGAIKSGGEVATYATPTDGWNALRHQITLILTDTSHNYRSDMSIAQIAGIWTGGDNPGSWGQTVAANLGLTISDPLPGVQA